MPFVSDNVPNLIQGISQQPTRLRTITQLAAQENCYSSVVEGLTQRPPTEYIAKVSTTPMSSAKIHTINRDTEDRFKAVLSNGLVQVFGLDGVSKTINVSDDTTAIFSAAAVSTGAVIELATATGETTIDFTTAGFGTATVVLEGSVTGTGSWVVMDTRTTNGTTAGIAIGTYKFVRGRTSAWTSGTITGSVTYKNFRYLLAASPKYELKALTIADYTFLLNTLTIPAMDTALSATRTEEALVFVRAGEYGSAYEVILDGLQRARYVTSTTDVLTLSTTEIANQLYTDLSQDTNTYEAINLPAGTGLATSSVYELDYKSGATTFDFTVTSGAFVASIDVEGSVDGISGWSVLATRTTAGTTAGIASGSNLFIRVKVTSHTSGAFTSDISWRWGGSYTFQLVASTIWVKRTKAFTLDSRDAQGGNSLFSFKGSTPIFANLPAQAPDGFVITVDADTATDKGEYYVKFVSQSGLSFGAGHWEETIKPGIVYSINEKTVPYQLVHEVNDSFTYGPVAWADRLVGDEDSNPLPSFIGASINAMAFYKNRLMLLADENFLGSEVSEYFNFWRTTVTQILDSDAVDFRATDQKVSILRQAILYNKSLLMFSDQAQFEIPADIPLTSTLVRADLVSNFESLTDVQPVNAGKSIHFAFARSTYTGLKELALSATSGVTMEADDVSAHVPAYIPAGAFHLAVSTLEGLSIILTDGDPDSIYAYKTEWKAEKKIQSAWFRWNFNDNTASSVIILSADFIGSDLYLLIQRNGEVFLERMQLLTGRVDDYSPYLTLLDRRMDDTQTVSRIYSAITDQTTITLPFTITSTETIVVTRSVADNSPWDDVGRYVPIISNTVGGTTIVVLGDYSANPIWIGQRVIASSTLSEIFKRSRTTGNIDPTGNLSLKRGFVTFSQSGAFQVKVDVLARPTSTYNFTGRHVGDVNNELGLVSLSSGKFSFGILGKSKHVAITFYSDSFLPFRLTSMEWEGLYTKRSLGAQV